ncbi:prolipoprotein diacylglyceryl transferase [Brevibacterium atlanticum]|uniref:prolipoprotein diacylglyceryl transferase n=1 Tax=Brevibacterium atlanticum TaxID=2697563 RepID=UPI0014215106|nr:prolipoprotein diacylglyceryl transferase family protein [Brevibacterium atlanticum]
MSFSPAWVVFIALGLGLALWMTSIQWQSRGGHRGDMWAIAVVSVPAAVIGGRIGHLLSAPDTYFGPSSRPLQALALWDGGFSFWGASLIGLLAVWLLTRFQGIRFLPLLDSVAPGLILGHVAGAFSDWFAGRTEFVTVLAESIWNLLACIVLIVVAKRLRLGYGQVFALYLCLFSLGRVLLEGVRLGTPEAEDARLLLGLPVNLWTAALSLLIGVVWLIVSRMRHRTQETGVYTHGARTLARRHRRGKHTYEINAPYIPGAVPSPTSADSRTSSAPLPSVSRIPEPADTQEASTDPRGTSPESAVPEDGEAVAQLAGRHSFGFFGAVTSAISIVPDVRGTSTPSVRDDDRGSSED